MNHRQNMYLNSCTKKQNNLLLHGHGVPEVNSKLSDVDEGMLVCCLCVQGVHLCESSLHKVDHGQHIGGCEFTVLYISNVHLLKTEGKKTTEKHKIIICWTKCLYLCTFRKIIFLKNPSRNHSKKRSILKPCLQLPFLFMHHLTHLENRIEILVLLVSADFV